MNTTIIRQIILDTETTGMNQIGLPYEGHKIIEIGAIEIINRRITGNNFHVYLKPDRIIDPDAFSVHGISDEFLLDKPSFSEIATIFFNFIYGSEIIMHNASFDIGFIDYEFSKLNRSIPKIKTFCKVTDSLLLARKLFPGKRNNIDALCSRYKIDNSNRILHSALTDAKILAKIYLAMTSGQASFTFEIKHKEQKCERTNIQDTIRKRNHKPLVIWATNEEMIAHESYLDSVQKKCGVCIWRIINK